ncbi:MAG TPA: tetratricopeptide repeat protein, partial [Spirochaetia bacterium]|nr:tetratricopeptide repeat protein [Spirochaetia bacterium]
MDSGSREFWDRLIPRSQDLPLGVLYLARGTNTQELPQARETLVLQPFIESDLQAFAEQSLGRPADEGLLDFLERRTNRIPLFVAELLRFLREHGLLIIGEDKARLGQVDGATLPASLQDLMLAELDGLPSDLKSGLPQLAVLGQRFPRKLCERLFGDQSPAVMTAYVQAGILEEADEEVRFTREIMRDTIYRIQLDARLKELHARAAELWISSTPEEIEASAEKAYHLHKAGRETEARGFYRIAAEQARLNFLNAEALRHYDNFLSLSDDEEANCLVRLDRAVIYELIGEWNNAIVELERGIGLAAISGHEELFSRFFAMIGQMRFKLGAHDAARVHLEKAIRDPRTRALLPPLVQSRIDLARVYILEGSYGEALNRLLEARDLAVEQGYHHEHALALYYLGVVYRTRGRKTEALDAYQESLRIFRNLRVPRYIAYPLYDLSLIYQYEGQLDKAHQSMQEALTIYTQIGYKSGLGAALLNMGAIEDQRGNFQAALDLFTRSRNITEELGEHLGVAYALFSIGASAYKAQEYAQALSYLNDADELVSRLRVDSYRGYALSYLACVLVRLGRFSEAIERVQEQLDVMERIKDDVEKGRIFLALAEICERAEQTDPVLASKLPELAARVGLEKSSALRWYRQAIKASLPSRYVNTLIPALYHCGLYLTRVRSDSAGRYLTRALQEAKRAGWTTYVERIETTLEGKAADRADKELLAASPSVDGR